MMSSNNAHCRFPNCSCKQHVSYHFHGTCMSGNPACSHPMQCHEDDNNSANNKNFSALPPQELPHCPNIFKDFNNSNFNQLPSAPNNRIFIPIIKGETTATIKCAPASNHTEAALDKKFEPHEQNSGRKRKSAFELSILLRMSDGMRRLNPKATKHK